MPKINPQRKPNKNLSDRPKHSVMIGIKDNNEPENEGMCKLVYEAISNPKVYKMFKVYEFTEGKFVIINFKEGCEFSNIYKELEYYSKFGEAGFSPVVSEILTVLRNGSIQHLHFTPDGFLSHFKDDNVEKPDSSDVWFLMEKADCGKKILDFYKDNYIKLFINLRNFLKRFVETFNLINADIKIDNLCIGKDGQFIMIDFDPDYIIDIRGSIDNNNIPIETKYFIDYMLFQTYINIIIWYGKNISIIFDKDHIKTMISKISNFKEHLLINKLYRHSFYDRRLVDKPDFNKTDILLDGIYTRLHRSGVSTVEPIEFEPPGPNIFFEPPGPNIFSSWGSWLFQSRGGKKTKRNNKKRSKKNRSRRF